MVARNIMVVAVVAKIGVDDGDNNGDNHTHGACTYGTGWDLLYSFAARV